MKLGFLLKIGWILMKIGRILMKMCSYGRKLRVELIFNGPGAQKHQNRVKMRKQLKKLKKHVFLNLLFV